MIFKYRTNIELAAKMLRLRSAHRSEYGYSLGCSYANYEHISPDPNTAGPSNLKVFREFFRFDRAETISHMDYLSDWEFSRNITVGRILALWVNSAFTS